MIFILLFCTEAVAMNDPRPISRGNRESQGHMRRISDVMQLMKTVPLTYARNIHVETYFTRGQDRHYDTMVIDVNGTTPKTKYLHHMMTLTHLNAILAHEAAEEWCLRMFPKPTTPRLGPIRPEREPPPIDLLDTEVKTHSSPPPYGDDQDFR